MTRRRGLRRLPALVLAGALVVAGVAGVAGVGCGDDDSPGEGDGDAGPGGTTSTTLETGGIEVDAPDGWRAVPLPALGLGFAVPDEWEAAVLSEEGLSAVSQADPAVPGFADAAHATAEAGGVFYAAGVEGNGQVTDLKVRAAPDSGVTDAAGLEAYARALAADAGLVEPTFEVVADAPQPTVRTRFRAEAERADPDDPTADPAAVTVEGSELLVLSPRGVVYSLIVTSEQADGHDELADTLFGTVTFPPADEPD